MPDFSYETFKNLVSLCQMPSVIFSVKKNDDGSCGEIRMLATNDKFSLTGENVEGELIDAKMPKDNKFEEVLFNAAWNDEHYHAYVDTTKLYGSWTEDIVIPLSHEEGSDTGYCQFMYNLTKEMDSGKYSIISPDIASFVIRTCLNLKKDDDFYGTMEVVTKDIREFTDAFAVGILTLSRDVDDFEVVSSSVRNNAINLADVFADIPYDVVASWEGLVIGTDCIILRNADDIKDIETKAPEWARLLREQDIQNVCLVPFMHQNTIIGYLYLTNFNTDNLSKIKDTVELVSFFLSSEVSHQIFVDRLKSLSSLDIRTGVLNRNAMNTKVDELALQLDLDPAPFSVAFCYLNTLKTINKNMGHEAGNNLLKDAGNILREVFKNDFIYRSAGDEFAVISPNSSEEEFEQKIEKLRESASNPEWVYFSVGYYTDLTEGKLHTAMHFANEYEREFKEEFYENYPDMVK